ncbi:GNAT family N-acetyltransferase [Tsuneonella sp. HG249]
MLISDIELGPELVRANRRDARQVGEITGDAFHDDPFNRWMLGTPAGITGVFRAMARYVYVPRGYSYRLGEEGAAMWMLPGGDGTPPWQATPAFLWAIYGRSSRGAGKRVDHAVAAMQAAHPTFEHAYLFTIGVRRRAQGKGLGRKLIAPVLAACDRLGLPAYLENSNPANRGFYGANGFERVGMIEAEPGAPPLEAMLRQPRV